ncbi:hypothetical protein ScPMuIL_018615 [Solemya velum]
MRRPEYSKEKWQGEWRENQLFMDNISHFPKDWWKAQSEKSGKRKDKKRSAQKSRQDDSKKDRVTSPEEKGKVDEQKQEKEKE